jgi:hypothetical protein
MERNDFNSTPNLGNKNQNEHLDTDMISPPQVMSNVDLEDSNCKNNYKRRNTFG